VEGVDRVQQVVTQVKLPTSHCGYPWEDGKASCDIGPSRPFPVHAGAEGRLAFKHC
jgi:hypothetical protein